jgi:hypothetical protein
LLLYLRIITESIHNWCIWNLFHLSLNLLFFILGSILEFCLHLSENSIILWDRVLNVVVSDEAFKNFFIGLSSSCLISIEAFINASSKWNHHEYNNQNQTD